jgi:hypothetical protein
MTGNIRRATWYKLWGNATINPLSALTRATCDQILADAECRAWMLDGMAELAAIGSAIGCPITESGEDRMAVPRAWARSRHRCCRTLKPADRSRSRPCSARHAKSRVGMGLRRQR